MLESATHPNVGVVAEFSWQSSGFQSPSVQTPFLPSVLADAASTRRSAPEHPNCPDPSLTAQAVDPFYPSVLPEQSSVFLHPPVWMGPLSRMYERRGDWHTPTSRPEGSSHFVHVPGKRPDRMCPGVSRFHGAVGFCDKTPLTTRPLKGPNPSAGKYCRTRTCPSRRNPSTSDAS